MPNPTIDSIDVNGTTYDITDTTSGYQEGLVVITSSSFSTLSITINNSAIKSTHHVVGSYLSNPEAQLGEWTVTTSDGSLTISGNIVATTTITLYLL
jgi:hypothetical protein